MRQLYDRRYDADPADPHYGAIAPTRAKGCECDSPLGLADELGDIRCFRCGRSLAPSRLPPAA